MTTTIDYAPKPAIPKLALWIEWAFLFAVVPVLYVTVLEPARIAKYPVFAVPFAYAGIVWLMARPKRAAPAQRIWRPFLPWFAVCLIVAPVLVWMLDPSLFFGFPRRHPRMFAVYMVLYPILSVWPQEFLYRRFYFWRYEPIFGSANALAWSSAVAFCLLHAIYHNWVAVVLSLVAGWVFAIHYARTGSLLVVWAEHTAYGWWAFTVGLGRYFYRPM